MNEPTLANIRQILFKVSLYLALYSTEICYKTELQVARSELSYPTTFDRSDQDQLKASYEMPKGCLVRNMWRRAFGLMNTLLLLRSVAALHGSPSTRGYDGLYACGMSGVLCYVSKRTRDSELRECSVTTASLQLLRASVD
jgi:hypothetical protein